MAKELGAGVDVGACTTKVAIVNGAGAVIGAAVKRSGHDLRRAVKTCWRKALEEAQAPEDRITRLVATGYGRDIVPFPHTTKTEITCHAKGAFAYFPEAITVVDIGGQDSKIIHVNDVGRRTGFKMNRKCAAGTGAFLEEMANRLDLPLSALDGLARKSDRDVELGSYCTVFTVTEVLEKIRYGESVENVIRGIFLSIRKRIIEMDPLVDKVVMTGGVAAHNPFLREILAEHLAAEVFSPPQPQLAGAIGAALLSLTVGE
jgi:predicted CoA-substrate-specific enzyme activase